MNADQKELLDYIENIEEAAADILADKQHVIELSKKNNGLREARRALEKDKSLGNKTWICMGNMFIKIPKTQAMQEIHKDEKMIESEINDVRNNLHLKVENLRNLEGQPGLTGFHLNPLSKEEIAAVKNIISTT